MHTTSWYQPAKLQRVGASHHECTGTLNNIVEYAVRNPLPGSDRWQIVCYGGDCNLQIGYVAIAELAGSADRPSTDQPAVKLAWGSAALHSADYAGRQLF